LIYDFWFTIYELAKRERLKEEEQPVKIY